MRIGFANGCFDCFHPGHDHFLRQARATCDWLIVAVNSDASVRRLKGPDRPVKSLQERMLDIDRTGCAQAIIPFGGDPIPLLDQILPDVLIRGEDQSGEGIGYAKHFVRILRLQGYSTTARLVQRGYSMHECRKNPEDQQHATK